MKQLLINPVDFYFNGILKRQHMSQICFARIYTIKRHFLMGKEKMQSWNYWGLIQPIWKKIKDGSIISLISLKSLELGQNCSNWFFWKTVELIKLTTNLNESWHLSSWNLTFRATFFAALSLLNEISFTISHPKIIQILNQGIMKEILLKFKKRLLLKWIQP